MFDLLKKSVYSTIGLAYLTREKLEEMGKKMAQDADATEEEGRKFIDELLKKSDEAKGAMSRQIHDIVEKTLRNLDLPTRGELRRLENRVAELERKTEPPKDAGPLG